MIVWKKGLTLLSAGQQMITRDSRFSLSGYNLHIREISHADQGDYTCQIGDGTPGDIIHKVEILREYFITQLGGNRKLISMQIYLEKGARVQYALYLSTCLF